MNINRSLWALGLIALLTGGAVGVAEFGNATYRVLALLACIVGTLLMRTSKMKGSTKSFSISRQNEPGAVRDGPGPLAWVVGVISIVAVAISCAALYMDASYGYHWEWPLYAFVGSIVIAAPAVGYLFAKMGWFI